MHSQTVRDDALRRLEHATLSDVSRQTGISRSTLRAWRSEPDTRRECPRCDAAVIPPASYAALLGFYLGDGCVSRMPRYYSLRVSCDARFPGVVADVEGLLRAVRPGRPVHHVRAPGTVVVQAAWRHWPCLLPQHGPGRKHERPIVLEPWQREVVERHPAAFLRGLFHSDGCRSVNTATRTTGGETRTHHYPRWQFTNVSDDIRGLCGWALDLAGVRWRPSNRRTISVSRRDDVRRLDELIGLKS